MVCLTESRLGLHVLKKSIIVLVLTFLVGGGFIFGADYWINAQERSPASVVTKIIKSEIKLKNVVVASEPLGFGMVLSSANLKVVSWPQNALPPNAFFSIDDMLADGSRVVLRPIETNEPILVAKITGSNESASLSKLIEDGHRAVTIRVNDVAGVAGFILPGDRVDVVLTRKVVTKGSGDDRARGRQSKTAVADLLLQGVRVLTIDQIADERSDKPLVAKAVTLELSTLDAQKVALASSVGDLSLLLRAAGDNSLDLPKTINLSDLSGSIAIDQKTNVPMHVKTMSQVVVRRPKDSQEYEVPIVAN
jgi:pilus assembly protein CpaB